MKNIYEEQSWYKKIIPGDKIGKAVFLMAFFVLKCFLGYGQCPPTIIVGQNGNPLINGDTIRFCPGDSVCLTAHPTSGVTYQWFNSTVPFSTDNPICTKQPGDYYVMVYGSGCIQPSVTKHLILKPSPVITITSGTIPPHICSGDNICETVTTQPPNVIWNWLLPPGYGNQNPLCLTLTTGTTFRAVGVNMDPSNLCANTTSLTVQVDDVVGGGSIQADQTICSGDTPAPLTEVTPSSGGNGTYDFKWFKSTSSCPGPGDSIPGAHGQDYSPGPLTQTTWFIRRTSSPPCPDAYSNCVQITVDPKPVISGPADTTICSGTSMMYQPNSNVTGTTFTWTSVFSSGNIVSGFTQNTTAPGVSGPITDLLTLGAPGTIAGTVTYTITPYGPAPTHCVGTPFTLHVKVNPIPSVTNTDLLDTICSGQYTAPVILLSNVSGAVFRWFVTFPSGVSVFGCIMNCSGNIIPSTQIINDNDTLIIVQYHIYALTPDLICQGPEQIYSVYVKPAPTVINSPMFQSICSGGTSAQVNLISNYPGTIFTWTASPSNPACLSGYTNSGGAVIPPQTITNTCLTVENVNYHIYPSNNISTCDSVDKDYKIYVLPKPQITSHLTDSLCSGSTFTYTMTSNIPGTTFHWYRPATPGNPAQSGTSNPIVASLKNLSNTTPLVVTYWLKAIFTAWGSSCAGDSVALHITVFPLPFVSAGNDTIIPCGTSTVLRGSATGGTGALIFSWQPTSLIALGETNMLQPSTAILDASGSPYKFYLTVTDGRSCINEDSVSVTVTLPCLGITPTAVPSSACAGEPVQLFSNVSGGSGNYSYYWTSNPPGFTSTLANPTDIPMETTIYKDSVSDGFTHYVGFVTVTVIPLPDITTTPLYDSICSGSSTNITLTSSIPGTTYSWTCSASSGSVTGWSSGSGNTINQTLINNGSSVETVTYHITPQSNGCNGLVTDYVVTINPSPNLVANPPAQTITSGSSTNIHLSSTTLGTTFSWTATSSAPCLTGGSDGTGSFIIQTLTSICPGDESYTYHVTPTINGCPGPSSNVIVTVHPYPKVFNVLGGGPYCAGQPGDSIKLDSSESGINYQLVRRMGMGYIDTLAAKTGTGAHPFFMYLVSDTGLYKVIAINPTTLIDTLMNGQAYVTRNPLPTQFGLLPDGDNCAGTTLALSGSQVGIQYRLLLGTIPDTAAIMVIMGTGLNQLFIFGPQVIPGIYSCWAVDTATGCGRWMDGQANLLANPVQVFVVNAGILCEGDSVCLDSSQVGVGYKLVKIGTYPFDTIETKPGTGHPFCFGPQTAGQYFVIGVNNTSPYCFTVMHDTASLNPLPEPYSIVPEEGHHCQGENGIQIGLNESQTGVNYILYRDGIFPIPDLTGIPGHDNQAISFGNQSVPGYYRIYAYYSTTWCNRWMPDTIWIDPDPQKFNFTPDGPSCPCQVPTLSSSQIGIKYTLLNITNIPPNPPSLPGSGSALHFPEQCDPGTYIIIATDTTNSSQTYCTDTMNFGMTIYPNPVPYTIQPTGVQCQGVDVSMFHTDTGIVYDLHRMINGIPDGPPICTRIGNGSFMPFCTLDTNAQEGVYRIIGGRGISPGDTCYFPMADSIVLCRKPSSKIISPSGHACLISTIDVLNSDPEVVYKLIKDGDILYPLQIKPGNGVTLTFNSMPTWPHFPVGYYVIDAVHKCSPDSCNRIIHDTVYVDSFPQVYSGPDDSVCPSHSITITQSWGLSVNPLSILWQAIPGNMGLLLNSSTLHPTFNAGTSAGIVTLVMAAEGIRGCTGVTATDTMKLTIITYPSISAGPDRTVCASKDTIILHGIATGYSIFQWQKPPSSNGWFNDITSLNPVYHPGTADISAGSVTLTFTASGLSLCPGQEESDSVIIYFNPLPTVNAGRDSTICQTDSVLLNGLATHYSNPVWSRISADGTFSNPASISTWYTPGQNDLSLGYATLKLSVHGNLTCSQAEISDTVIIFINPSPVVNAGTKGDVCPGYAYELFATAIHYDPTTVHWMANGPGVFTHSDSLHTFFTPWQSSGNILLTVSVSGTSPECSSKSDTDQMMLEIIPHPAVKSGNDTTLCASVNTLPLSASAPGYHHFQWYSSTNGLFTPSNDTLSIYHINNTDRTNGSVVLFLKASGILLCPADTVTDQMTVTFDPLPSVTAGNDTTICATDCIHLINSSFSGGSNPIWTTIIGSGTFSPSPDILHPTYCLSPADTSRGYVRLRLTVHGALSCSSDTISSSVKIYITPLPFINAGPDAYSCGDTTFHYQITQSQARNYNQVHWNAIDGSGAFKPTANTLHPYYYPTLSDIIQGFVHLKVSDSGSMACKLATATDTMKLIFNKAPTANAGPNDTICAGQFVQLQGDTTYSSGVIWSSILQGQNGFTPGTNIINPQYHPNAAEINQGHATLILKAFGSLSCTSDFVRDTVIISINKFPTAHISGNATICEGDSAQLTVHLKGSVPFSFVYLVDGTQPFTISNIWDTIYQFYVHPIVLTSYSLYSVSDAHCLSSSLSGNVFINVHLKPASFNMTPSSGWNYCEGEQGILIGLEYSEAGVIYELKLLDSTLQTVIRNTAGPFNFGYQTLPGTYRVWASKVYPSFDTCHAWMPGSITITVTPLPNVGFYASFTCEGEITHFYLTGLPSEKNKVGHWIWNFGDGSPTVSYDTPHDTMHLYPTHGSYDVTLIAIDSDGICTNVIHHQVIVPPLPNAFYSYSYPTCQNQPVFFQDHSSNLNNNYFNVKWVWDLGNGTIKTFLWPVNPNFSYIYNTPGIYLVKLTVTNNDSCKDTYSDTVRIIPAPVPNFTYWNLTACANEPVQFIDLSQTNGGGPIVQWAWNFGDPSSGTANQSNDQNPTHIFPAGDSTYQVRLIVHTSNSCTDTVIWPVFVHHSPPVDFTYDTACLNQLVHFNANSGITQIDSIVTWSWDFGDGSLIVHNPVTASHLYLTAGTFTTILTVTDNHGCHNTKSHTVRVNPLPFASFTWSFPNCQGSTVDFFDYSWVTGGYIGKWKWHFDDGSSDITITPPGSPDVSHIFFGNGLSHTVRLTVWSNDSCFSYVDHIVTSVAAPVANFTFQQHSCATQPTQFNDQSAPNGGGPIVTWWWDFGDPTSGNLNNSSAQNPIHIWMGGLTSYDVTLIVTNGSNCSDTIAYTVSVDALPVASFTADTVCFGNPTTFTNASTGGNITQYWWTFGDGGTSPNANPTHMYATASTFNVTLTVTTDHGCHKDTTRQVLVIPTPVANFSASSPTCAGIDSVHFTDLSYASYGSIKRWFWDFGDGHTMNILSPGNPNVYHKYTQGGTFNVSLTVHTGDSCTNTKINPVVVQWAPAPNFDFDPVRCENTPVQFTDLTQQNGGAPLAVWAWDFGDPNSGPLNTSGMENPTHPFSTFGNFIVKLTVTNANGCQDTISKPVSVAQAPNAKFTADTACAGNITTFTDQSVPHVGTITSWLWNFGDPSSGTLNTSTLQNPTHPYTSVGTFLVSLHVTNTNTCGADTSQWIMVNPKPIAMFQHSTVCVHDSTQFTDLSIAPGSTNIGWYWEFGDGFTSTIQNPYHTYQQASTFNVTETVTNLQGCKDSITMPVIARPTPIAAFTYINYFCPAGKVDFQDGSQGMGAAIVSHYWIFEPGQTSPSVNPSHVFSSTNTTYSVMEIVTDNFGCQDTVVESVFVKPAFKLGMSYNSACFHDSTQFHALNLDNSPDDPLHNFHWDFGDPTSGSNNSFEKDPKHAFTGAGPFLVTLTAMNSDNCSDTVYKSVITHALPVPGFTYDQIPYCDTSPVVFHFDTLSISSTLDSLIWRFGNSKDTSLKSPFRVNAITHIYTPGHYKVWLIAYNSYGCHDSISKDIFLTCLVAQFKDTTGTLTCTNYPVIFKDNSYPRSYINTWNWDFGDGSQIRSYNAPAKDTIHHAYTFPGIYWVKLTVSTTVNGNPITSTDSIKVTLYKSSIAGFSASNVCSGQPVLFRNLSDSNDVHILNYQWVYGDDSIHTDTVWEDTCTHKYKVWGHYNASLVVQNTNGCSDTMTKQVWVYKLPVARIESSLIGCARDYIHFKDSSSVFGGTTLSKWEWYYNDPLKPYDIGLIQNPSHIYDAPGIYNVLLRVTDKHSCFDTISALVKIDSTPFARFTFTDKYNGRPGNLLMDNQSTGTGGKNPFTWTFNNILNSSYSPSSSNDMNPIVTFENDGTYDITLIARNSQCADTTIYRYDLLFTGLYIPNAFSPTNPDLAVRLFKPVGINLKEYHIQVFDNWGHLMWESIKLDSQGKPREGWDGTFNGQLMPQGVYIWKATAVFIDATIWQGSDIGKGEYKTMGTVTLIR